jgi:hypothetical protein
MFHLVPLTIPGLRFLMYKYDVASPSHLSARITAPRQHAAEHEVNCDIRLLASSSFYVFTV